ncbi:helix-turn-helix transcriptional regulator [Maricurvus nonylphenolicus]|uniref:helix-turn-helix domain-containing protein n=1 Tax=Maricurvus nonylphenolicus TaxID=1008307 RepID=UPI0036F1D5F4
MSVQVIMKDGRPEWAVIPYAEYEALLEKAGQATGEKKSSDPAPAPSGQAVSALAKLMGGQGAGEGTFSPQKMAELRQAKSLEHSMMSREVGISPSYLAQIEAGEREPSDAVIRNIARALGVEISQLQA